VLAWLQSHTLVKLDSSFREFTHRKLVHQQVRNDRSAWSIVQRQAVLKDLLRHVIAQAQLIDEALSITIDKNATDTT
jgi:hypothetical protein